MLKDYPTIMNDTTIPFFPEMENTPQKIENINQSEAADDIVQVIRDEKMSVSVKLALADVTWVKFFYELYQMDSFIMKQYNPLLAGYDERTVRIENFKYKAKKKSEDLAAVTGVWDVSFTIEEF